jgi:hypothetical protein
MEKYKLEHLAIQDTRWLGQGICDYKGYSTFCSGKSEGSHEIGTAYVVSKKLGNNVIDCRPINERVCALRMKQNPTICGLLMFIGPTEDKAEEITDDFYQTLENTYNAVLRMTLN